MERYYQEFECPMYRKYKKQLIPFAIRFYKGLNKSSLDYIKVYVNYMKPHYTKFLFFETRRQYVDYYERKLMTLDNLCRATNSNDCLL
jgi:hypothetical protein